MRIFATEQRCCYITGEVNPKKKSKSKKKVKQKKKNFFLVTDGKRKKNFTLIKKQKKGEVGLRQRRGTANGKNDNRRAKDCQQTKT